MEEARTSETSVDICLTTRQYIPEDSELHTRYRENLKSHNFILLTKVWFFLNYSAHSLSSVCSLFKVGNTNQNREHSLYSIKVKLSHYTPRRRLKGEEV